LQKSNGSSVTATKRANENLESRYNILGWGHSSVGEYLLAMKKFATQISQHLDNITKDWKQR